MHDIKHSGEREGQQHQIQLFQKKCLVCIHGFLLSMNLSCKGSYADLYVPYTHVFYMYYIYICIYIVHVHANLIYVLRGCKGTSLVAFEVSIHV